MTEKRFTIEIDDENISHILDNNTDIGQYNLCKLLNELADENEQLRKENQALKDANEGLTGTIAHYIDEEGLE